MPSLMEDEVFCGMVREVVLSTMPLTVTLILRSMSPAFTVTSVSPGETPTM